MKNEEYESKEYLFLKRNWKLFLIDRNKLRKIKKINKRTGEVYDFETLIDATLNKYKELYYVYWTREEFCKYAKSLHYYMETREMMTFFVKKFTHSEIKEVQEIGFTISRWFEEIVNSYAKNTTGFVLTNAIAEANNNNIQTLVDLSYGLGNFERLRNRILYINKNKKTRSKCSI